MPAHAAADGTFAAVSDDGNHVFFVTGASLVPGDTDGGHYDVYERSAGTTSLVTTGPSGGNGNADYFGLAGISDDGTHAFFQTDEQLVPQDNDQAMDVYDRSGGTTTLVSKGPAGGNGDQYALFAGSSADGAHVFFTTRERLVAGDTDLCTNDLPPNVGCRDVYERTGGVTKLVSAGGNGPYNADYAGSSADGRRVFFETAERLTSDDHDIAVDVYRRAGTTTKLISTGPRAGSVPDDAQFVGASTDGTRAFFETAQALVSGDTDGGRIDVYRRAGTTTTLISTGPRDTGNDDAHFDGASADGSRVLFESFAPYTAGDRDSFQLDIYARSGGTTELVSGGPVQPTGTGADAYYDGASANATDVFFSTSEELTADDTDDGTDVYEYSGGLTRLVSTGNGPYSAFYRGASSDGSRVFFLTDESLDPGDTDSCVAGTWVVGCDDVYERSGGDTALLSIGPASANGPYNAEFDGASADGTKVFFTTEEPLVAADTNGGYDVYERSGGTTTLISQP